MKSRVSSSRSSSRTAIMTNRSTHSASSDGSASPRACTSASICPGDTVQITLQGLRRIVVDEMEQTDPYPIAAIRAARETPADPAEIDDLVTRVVSAAETLAELVDRIPDEVPAILKMNVSDPGRFADLAATNMNFRIADKDEVLQRLDVGQRLRFILIASRARSRARAR